MSEAARYLALGDSYTIGEGVDVADRWPAQLVRALRSQRVAIDDPEIIARTGWTTDELDRAITERAPSGSWRLVTLLIGVNNQYRGRAVTDYRVELHALIARAVGFADADAGRVIVVGIPDWGVTPFNTMKSAARVASDIDEYNRVAADEARVARARWVPVTDLTRADPHAVVADGLHPNAAMYAKWVDRIAPVARTILQRT